MLTLRRRSKRVICAAPGYLKRRGVPQRPDDLLAHDCLRLHTQPALSMQINELEQTLGLTLVERTRNGVRLTPKGQRRLDALRGQRRAHSTTRAGQAGVP